MANPGGGSAGYPGPVALALVSPFACFRLSFLNKRRKTGDWLQFMAPSPGHSPALDEGWGGGLLLRTHNPPGDFSLAKRGVPGQVEDTFSTRVCAARSMGWEQTSGPGPGHASPLRSVRPTVPGTRAIPFSPSVRRLLLLVLGPLRAGLCGPENCPATALLAKGSLKSLADSPWKVSG